MRNIVRDQNRDQASAGQATQGTRIAQAVGETMVQTVQNAQAMIALLLADVSSAAGSNNVAWVS